jgi:S-DNA-T family DNA segregation ATPase FtsK/SpoIIIE
MNHSDPRTALLLRAENRTMKDASVSPAGLFAPKRQRRLLDALVERFACCQSQRYELLERHTREREEEEKRLAASRGRVTEACRRRRRETLGQWDAAEESVFSHYEDETVRLRMEINRLAALYRRKTADGRTAIENKVAARKAAVLEQYEARRHQPGEQSRKEIEAIQVAMVPLNENLQLARELTIRRLDRLPEVPPPESPADDPSEPTPESIRQCVETIERLSEKCRGIVTEMQTGASAKFVDSFYLPGAVFAIIVLWCIGVIVAQPQAFWLYLVSGVVVAGVLGFMVYAALLFPLRGKTKRLYPLIERVGAAAEEVAGVGKALSADQARETSEELIQQRDQHLQAAKRWRVSQLEELEHRLEAEQQAARKNLVERLNQLADQFRDQHHRVTVEMNQTAEQVAGEIKRELEETDQSLRGQREANVMRRQDELRRVTDRMRDGVRSGLERISLAGRKAHERFPAWEEWVEHPAARHPNLDFVPLGKLHISGPLSETLARPTPGPAAATAAIVAAANASGNGSHSETMLPPMFQSDEIPSQLPVALHRRLHSGLMIRAASGQMERAVELVHQTLWRMLSGTVGGRTKLTLIDPIGRGQNFTTFMPLADHDPALVNHRVWTTENQIEARLGEIAQHAEDVLQSCLRDQFRRVEDYNQLAGSMAEPYRAVAAVGFPEGMTRAAYKHLKALIESGIRCGVFVLLVCDRDQPWPAEFPEPKDARLLELSVDEAGTWKFEQQGLERYTFEPEANVPQELRSDLVEIIGQAATASAKVEIPLPSLLESGGGELSSDHGLEITIGSLGGHRKQSVSLGEGVRQHVLIAGKTGSGKSTLLHCLITSGAFHYTPDQLQYYLLDFKKGVEFKVYADRGLPHARVIGIESEREFGRSVLGRLDEELQRRGELFRSVSAQEIAEYRSASGQSMPRIVLVIDEFQELFVRDDRVAAECAMLLDRLVRQGRSFGIHVVLSSQSLAGAYSLPRATLGQMAVRIAMQCSESDAALILSDDNTAARLLTRPGEAIYNDASGLVEGNHPFQVAWLSGEDHEDLLRQIGQRDAPSVRNLPPPVIFEGNRPCRWSSVLADAAVGENVDSAEELHGLLGESVEIGPPVSLELSRNAGRNVLLIPPVEARGGLLASVLSGFAKSNPKLEVIYFNGNRPNETPSLFPWLQAAGINAKEVKPRESEAEVQRLVEIVKERGDEAQRVPPIVAVLDPLDRFRDFRHDDTFNFSLDAGGALSGGQAFREILKDGPPAGVFCLLVCGSAEIVSRWLPRQSQHDVELRVLGRLNPSDSSLLIDSPMAAELSAATMVLYDEPTGQLRKFRQTDQAEPAGVQDWLTP